MADICSGICILAKKKLVYRLVIKKSNMYQVKQVVIKRSNMYQVKLVAIKKSYMYQVKLVLLQHLRLPGLELSAVAGRLDVQVFPVLLLVSAHLKNSVTPTYNLIIEKITPEK